MRTIKTKISEEGDKVTLEFSPRSFPKDEKGDYLKHVFLINIENGIIVLSTK